MRPPDPPAGALAPAGLVTRMLAVAVDALLLAVGLELTVRLVRVAEQLLRSWARLDFATLLGLLAPLIIGTYHVAFWRLAGRTPGKLLLGLRVVDHAGGGLSTRQAILRLFGYLLSAAPLYLGFLWMLVDPRRRCWHDLLARTLVVYDRPPPVRKARAPGPGLAGLPQHAVRGAVPRGGIPVRALAGLEAVRQLSPWGRGEGER